MLNNVKKGSVNQKGGVNKIIKYTSLKRVQNTNFLYRIP